MIKVDPALKSQCGYLVVPENRAKPTGRTIKIPFVYVRNPKDPNPNTVLHTTGGPGYSTIPNFDSIRVQSGWLSLGGFIAFDQRGTKKAIPCLDCPEKDEAVKRAYRENLSLDSLIQIATTQCRQKFVKQGIDLSAYNTVESAADINDLRKALHIDSLSLFGISYSGGLMLTVARNHPEGVKALLLNSPLPANVNYEEHALFNFNEALEQVFANCAADSAGKEPYLNLRERFHDYFTRITGQRFIIDYVEKGHTDTLHVRYGKSELLDAVFDRMNSYQMQTVPAVMNDLIAGNHTQYVKEQLDGRFGDNTLSYGMRLSMYCTEQIAYADKDLTLAQEKILPWLAGFRFNDPNHGICDCWKVKPEPPAVKKAFYSTIPALFAAGDADPWCRPFYNRQIKRCMPNAQLIIVHNHGHIPSMYVDGFDYVKLFFQAPYKKLVSTSKNVIIE